MYPFVREDDHDFLHQRERLVLRLLHDLGDPLAASELLLGLLVEVRAELRERRELAVLRELELQAPDHGLHGFRLRIAADARHRETAVHGRPLTLVEEVGLEEDLAVGDRNDVRRDVCRDVVRLRFDDRQRGREPPPSSLFKRAAARGGASAGRRVAGRPRRAGRRVRSETWR